MDQLKEIVAPLTSEEKELILDLKHSDSYRVIIKLLNLLARHQSEDVLKVDLSQTTDRDLALAKARAEGANKLVRAFHTTTQKTASKSPSK